LKKLLGSMEGKPPRKTVTRMALREPGHTLRPGDRGGETRAEKMGVNKEGEGETGFSFSKVH